MHYNPVKIRCGPCEASRHFRSLEDAVCLYPTRRRYFVCPHAEGRFVVLRAETRFFCVHPTRKRDTTAVLHAIPLPLTNEKVDIMMRWDANGTGGEYDVLVDGVARAEDMVFGRHGNGSSDGGVVGGIERVGLYVLGEGRAWFDEIYLGPDFTMGETRRRMCSSLAPRRKRFCLKNTSVAVSWRP